jgi:ADP-ribose pyrophosphatase
MQSKLMYSGKFLEIYEDEHNNGKMTLKWERCSRKNNTKAVMIVPYHISKEKYLMIQEFRIPIRGYEIGFPAGLIEENENIEDAIKRELKEETGMDLVSIKEISPFTYSSSGMTDEAVAIAFVDVDGEVSDKFLEPSEDIIPMLVSKNEIEKLMKLPDLKWGSKAWLICKEIKEN